MPLKLFYTMVQKSQNWPKTQIKGGGGPALKCTVKRCHLWKLLVAYEMPRSSIY